VQARKIFISYFNMRAAIGLCAMALPLLVLISSGWSQQSSISAYYHVNSSRDIFVACLCVIGMFLLTYSGYSDEEWLTRLMGLAAIGTGLFPTAQGGVSTWVGYVHYGCAVLLLVGMSLLALYFFPKNQRITRFSETVKRTNAVAYQICGLVILSALMFLLGAYLFLGEKGIKESTILFWVELISIEAFGVAWFWKSHATLGILRRLKLI
jgi:hypothetical protein